MSLLQNFGVAVKFEENSVTIKGQSEEYKHEIEEINMQTPTDSFIAMSIFLALKQRQKVKIVGIENQKVKESDRLEKVCEILG